jgi:hypothetical protein
LKCVEQIYLDSFLFAVDILMIVRLY